jgi:prepilin-type N-terminal cleavage/methylation domain-containing protein
VTTMSRLRASSCRHRTPDQRSATVHKTAFTLIELLVVVVILAVLASLSLAGLAGARQRAKIDKTRSTIRKLHEIVTAQYDSYLIRRVSIPAHLTNRTAIAEARLTQLRRLMASEMPDMWDDVYDTPADAAAAGAPATAKRYAAFKYSLSLVPNPAWALHRYKYQGSECLAMAVTKGGFAAEAAEHFRSDEIGDIDSDGAPEFWDGWNRPIDFIRWPAGYVMSAPGWLDAGKSPLTAQNPNTALSPDPFDRLSVSALKVFPASAAAQRDYGTFPLIYSPGPDEANNDQISGAANGYGLQTSGTSWLKLPLDTVRFGTVISGTLRNVAGDIKFDNTNPSVFAEAKVAVTDNITNHELLTK